MKHLYAKPLYPLLLLTGLVYGSLSFGGYYAKDDRDTYEVIIENNYELGPIFYSFQQTSKSGKLIPDQKQVYDSSNSRHEIITTINKRKFPALQSGKTETERKTQHTTFFVSTSETSLKAVLAGTATKDHKIRVFSKDIPTKKTGPCGGSVTFLVRSASGSDIKLSIKVKDDRTC